MFATIASCMAPIFQQQKWSIYLTFVSLTSFIYSQDEIAALKEENCNGNSS